MAEGPDFICVGMLKGGTRWLFDQLQFHPDFWMPPIKELHYLDRDDSRSKNAKQALKLHKKGRRKTQSADRDYDERDLAFLGEMAADRGPLDMDRYAALFRHKGDKLTGDVTPHYSALDDATIAEVTGYLKDVRILLLLRDPVARAWSQILQAQRRSKFSDETMADPEAFGEAITGWRKLRNLSSGADAAKRWSKHVPKERFRYIFMDDIIARPDETRAEVLTFLGADPSKPSGELEAGHNAKSNKKAELTDEARGVLAGFLKDEIRESAEYFGGHAVEWARKYGF